MEKVAESGAVTLREAGRNVLVEAKADSGATLVAEEPPVAVAAAVEAETDEETLPPSPMTMQDGIRAVQAAFGGPTPPRWPMYVRQAKQFLRNAIEGFDERNYGFATVVDLLRAAGQEGVLRIERDRQGAVRVFAGPKLAAVPAPPAAVEAEPAAETEPAVVNAEPVAEVVAESPIVEAVVVEPPAKAPRRRKAAKPKSGPDTPKPKRAAKSRKTVRTKDVAADRPEKRR
jgi:hypothetical protein